MKWAVGIALFITFLVYWKMKTDVTSSVPPTHEPRQIHVEGPANSKESTLLPLVEKKIRDERKALATCVLKEINFNSGKLRMKLLWDGAGSLKSIVLEPEPSLPVKDCLWNLVSTWRIGVHPTLQPFSFTTQLVFSGN